MKKIGIITIIDNENCGNRLQNFAMQKAIEDLGCIAITVRNEKLLNSKHGYTKNFLRAIKKSMKGLLTKKNRTNFYSFNKNIYFTKKLYTAKNKNLNKRFDYFIAGSDQIWKPTRQRLSYIDLLGFADNEKRISYAASFGISSIDEVAKEKLRKELPKFKAISVRENAGIDIIKDATGIENVQVVLDPTMLVSKKDWSKLEKKPKNLNSKKYVLTYFLGNNTSEELAAYCESNDLDIVDFYKSAEKYGPSEFLYLIHHANLVITDSFHGTVFSILFNRPFLICKRQEKAVNNDMYSRIDTLLGKFGLEKQTYDGHFDEKKLNIDYKTVEKNLKKEQEKSLSFLKEALDIKD